MVFSSIPAYLDPSNWNQQQNHQIVGSSSANPLLPPPPPPSQPHGGAGAGAGSIRPGSMAERARMSNIPLPETALKCPRCESTNTKFCYFNNYNLSQPRHFCKTCRRYWTRGGALRNVPVGGGCRRNKRSSKSSSTSKSPASNESRQTNPTSTSTVSTGGGAGAAHNLLGLNHPQFPPLRFMSPLGLFGDNFAADMGLNYGGVPPPSSGGTSEMNFHGAANLLGGGGGIEPWRLQQVQQFPNFMGGGVDTSSSQGGYHFPGGELGFIDGGETSMRPKISSPMVSQRGPVKMEGGADRSLSRQMLGGMRENEEWSHPPTAANWSSFSSSSTTNPL